MLGYPDIRPAIEDGDALGVQSRSFGARLADPGDFLRHGRTQPLH